MVWAVCCVVAGAIPAHAAETADAHDELEVLTITATRLARSPFDTPASIQGVELRRDSYGVNVADSLSAVPGLVARDRQNYAQDTQISVRGFGARSPFGIRGVRLYIDGIPATQPDGQGQVSHFNLATAERVEVLRGPFSALYGNSSGGVIQLFTADGSGAPSLQAGTAAGSAGTWRLNLGSSGEAGGSAYNVGVMRFSTDGTRGHSAARRDSLQVKLALPLRVATISMRRMRRTHWG
jgi:iron complex outermembrane recepter protein